jgi:PAS domain S-box-containing protein
MAQGTAAQFANRAPLTGAGSRNHFRLGEWKIGTLLTGCFAAIVLLMIVGDAIAVLQLGRVETQASRFYQADQKSLAIMHVYLDVVTFRDTLTGLAHGENPREFASRATALRDNFLTDVTHAQQTLSSAPDVSQDPTILIRLETVRAALPSQVDTFLELVKVEDWQAVRFRLAGQVQPLIALSSSLVADVEQEVAQERARALESVQRTRRQLYLVLPITALLILLIAAMLGWYATHRISRPLAQLDVGAQALARGEFGSVVELRGNDELADLARAFNYAAQQLHKLYDDIKRSEAYLGESKAKLEEAQRITHVGYWEWDLATNGIKWSDETYRIYGMRPQERPMDMAIAQEKIHPEDWQRGMEAALGGGARFNAECRLFRPTGEMRIAHFQGEVKRDESGQPCYIFGTVQDITDRKRAEENLELMSSDLQESKTRLEEAQRIAHVGHWVWDLTSNRVIWSDETYRIYGLRPQEYPIDIAVIRKMIHPEDLGFVFRVSEEAIRAGLRTDVEHRIIRPSGELRTVHSQGDLKKDTSGRPCQTFGTVQDITDRKRADEALQQNQIYLAEGQRLAHMGSWAFNAAGFEYWSPELFRIHGLDPSGEPPTVEEYLALVHPEDHAFMKQGISQMFHRHLAFDFTKRIVWPDGEIRSVRCVGVPVTQGGMFHGFLGTGMDVTEQERLTEELRRSEHYLSEGQRLAHMGSWAFNPSGFFEYWSEELFKIYGLDPQKGAPTLEQYLAVVHPLDRNFMAETIKRMLAERSGCDVKKRIILPDREQRYIRCVGIPVVEGEILKGFLGTAIDITEQELLTQELERRQAHLAEAQRLTHTGSWTINVRTDEHFWSEEIFRIYEFDTKVKPAWSLIRDRVHPDDRASLAQRRKMEFTQTGWTDSEADLRIVLPDGRIKHLHTIAHPVKDAAGQIVEVIGTTMDVTERKRIEDSLRRSESHLAEAQKLTHTASWAWRAPDRNAVEVSEEFYRIFGFDPAEGAPTPEEYLERVHPEDRLKWRGMTERAIVEKADYDHEFRILLPNGTAKWIHTVGHPVLSDAGDLEQFVGSSTDITERKSAEQEREKLRELEADLAHINRVSTLGEMAASLAHEIKQPIAAAITSANSCIEWLAHEPPNLDRARAAAARIDKYGNRAAEIIDRIRSLYKKSPPQRELVDVNGIIQEMLTLLKGEADRCSVAMRAELAAELPKVIADRVQLQQVFMNLMLNAIEAMKDSGGEITVKSQFQDGQLQFSVSDTGVGLPAEQMDQIFSAFFTTKPQGSGMGLAISRSIVESHGGRLWATANDGRGATFYFTLPTDVTEPTPLVFPPGLMPAV